MDICAPSLMDRLSRFLAAGLKLDCIYHAKHWNATYLITPIAYIDRNTYICVLII